MTDEDNFDIDIYGDDTVQDYTNGNSNDAEMKQGAGASETLPEGSYNTTEITNSEKEDQTDHGNKDSAYESVQNTTTDGTSQIASTGGSTEGQYQPPKQAPIQQGTKRKEGSDDRPVDPNATTALLISELQWWTNEDDMRGWANQSGCEDELVDVTFNEHKVNGKSKGQVFVEMASPQAATALKHQIESFGQGQPHQKKYTVQFHAPHINPYKTLPKDVPGRKDGNRQDNRSSSTTFGGQGGMNNMNNNFNNGGFRGGRGGFNNNRGGMNNMNNFNRNFSQPPMGGMNGPGFNPIAPGFNSNMGGMSNFNNFNRGGMMGGMRGGMPPNRGGRGGMGIGMGGMGMGGMPNMGMGGMPMGPMGGNMNMAMGGMPGLPDPGSLPPQSQERRMVHPLPPRPQPRRAAPQPAPRWLPPRPMLGEHPNPRSSTPPTLPGHGTEGDGAPGNGPIIGPGGFGGNQHFNPGFFGQGQQTGGADNWNPHGAKRQREN